MQSIQALRERRAAVAQNMKALLDGQQDKAWGNEHQEKYDAYLKEVDSIDADLRNVQAYLDTQAETHLEAQAQEQFNADNKNPKLRDIYAKWLRGGDKAMAMDDWTAVQNALSTGTDTEGGFTIQTDLASTLIEAQAAHGGMRDVATVIQTASGSPMSWATTDGTQEEGEWVPENQSASDEDPEFNTVGVNVYKLSSKVVTIPWELIQDSNINIEAMVNGRLARRLARTGNKGYTNGTGTGQPFGITARATAGRVGATGQVDGIIEGDLLKLYHALDPAYRNSAHFMMHDSTLLKVRDLKDAQGRPIYLPAYTGMAGMMSDTLWQANYHQSRYAIDGGKR
jgi:HK97 family phage major capsid protein